MTKKLYRGVRSLNQFIQTFFHYDCKVNNAEIIVYLKILGLKYSQKLDAPNSFKTFIKLAPLSNAAVWLNGVWREKLIFRSAWFDQFN